MLIAASLLVMGHPYDPAIDIWSIGCTLYELYTGKILFPGRSNNQMLLLMMELKGRFNQKMIKRAKFGDMYFDELGAFLSVEPDRVTGSVSFLVLRQFPCLYLIGVATLRASRRIPFEKYTSRSQRGISDSECYPRAQSSSRMRRTNCFCHSWIC